MNEGSKAILLTPPGQAAIAVVRLAGPQVSRFLGAHFSRPPVEGRCIHGSLSDGTRVIDDPVVVVHAGVTVADVNLHGGPWVVRSVLELARRHGFVVLDRPEIPLPEEAVDARTGLQREVIRYVPLARTELALRVLLGQEVAWSRPPQANEVPDILADRSLHWLLHPPRVAVVGAPNVGKSTLANQLFAQQRSITADVPGTTRDWVGEVANVDGLAVMLVDTPGVRQTTDQIEREAIERARGQVEAADLVVVVTEPSQPALPSDVLPDHPGAIHVLNKSDLAPTALMTTDCIRTVATTGQGVDALRAAIKRRFLGGETVDVARPRWWTVRQREILERARADPSALTQITA